MQPSNAESEPAPSSLATSTFVLFVRAVVIALMVATVLKLLA
jgi:hypothetical protein